MKTKKIEITLSFKGTTGQEKYQAINNKLFLIFNTF